MNNAAVLKSMLVPLVHVKHVDAKKRQIMLKLIHFIPIQLPVT